jgi:hypothetical protein
MGSLQCLACARTPQHVRSRVTRVTSPKSPFRVLGGRAIARVPAIVADRIVFLIAEVFGDLGLHGTLQHGFGELLQQTVFANYVFWLFVAR